MMIDSDPGPTVLSEPEMRIIAEVAMEMARVGFDAHATAVTLARASLRDAGVKKALALTHRSILTKRAVDPHQMLAPIAPLLRELQQKATRVLATAAEPPLASGWSQIRLD